MGDFPPSLFPALDLAAEPLECLDEEALDVVGLQALSFGSLNLEAQLLNPRLRHGVAGELPFL